MPNWCNNTVTIIAPAEEIDRIQENGPITFEKFFPMPDHIIRGNCPSEKMHDPDWWYQWSLKHWGTKWDMDPMDPKEAIENGFMETDEADPEKFPGMWYVKFHFDTAWSPPIELFDNYTELHPESHVTLEYYELGMWFAGEAAWSYGKRLYNREGEPEPNVHYDPDMMEE